MKYETGILQNKDEIKVFGSLLAHEKVKSYLEVGSKFGGSLWSVGRQLPVGSRIVSVDLPHGDKSFKESLPPLQECVKALRGMGYDAHLIIGDSTAQDVIDKVYALGPFDAAFIDANHTLPYVQKDFDNYSKVTKIIAFHDIGFYREKGMPPGKKPIEVPIFWNAIKKKYRNVEYKYDKQDNGIGVLWL